MNRNNKGFTLVELLAVIVILGLLMAIAIPSVTKYITQSRVKTLVSTMDSYVTAVVTQVNNGEYKFSDSTKIFAIPIECISLEKGGQSPFGNWMQANENYWAYVLVHYDSENYNYQYGFTFKDDAGYGLYPTLNSKIENSMVRTGYDDLTQPKDGLAIEFVSLEKWEGFENVSSMTELVVLEAGSEGEEGDGQYTCTLQQKGDNYAQIENDKVTKPQLLTKLIKRDNSIIYSSPTLTTSSNNTSDANGLYSSSLTNSGRATYYFRGKVENNYVNFANQIWRVIRINEDGTIRLIAENRINNTTYTYNGGYSMYYSNGSKARDILNSWYNSYIVNKGYDSYVANGTFCEQAKVKETVEQQTQGLNMSIASEYVPSFKCYTDNKGFGVLNLKVGLITIDELLFAGDYFSIVNNDCYLTNGKFGLWTMSPAGYDNNSFAFGWAAFAGGDIAPFSVSYGLGLRPVINLNANVMALGSGISSDPYVIQ